MSGWDYFGRRQLDPGLGGRVLDGCEQDVEETDGARWCRYCGDLVDGDKLVDDAWRFLWLGERGDGLLLTGAVV